MWPFNRKKVQLLNIMGNIVRSDYLVGVSDTVTTKDKDSDGLTMTCSFTVWLKSGQSFLLSVTEKLPAQQSLMSKRQLAELEEGLSHDVFELRKTVQAYIAADADCDLPLIRLR